MIILSVEHESHQKVLFTTNIEGSRNLELRGERSKEVKTVTLFSGDRTDVAVLDVKGIPWTSSI